MDFYFAFILNLGIDEHSNHNSFATELKIIDKFMTAINYKDENIIDDFNYSRFLNHINNLTDNTVLTKKEFLNLFNSYKFYRKELGIMALNKFMNENNLIYGNDRLTDYAKENNILTRDTYKNHNKVFFTKNGILYISNLLINNMYGDYKIKRK